MPGKVIIVDHYSGIGGAELSLAGLLEATPSGPDYWEAAFPADGPIPERLRSRGFEVHFLRMEGWRWWLQENVGSIRFALTLPLQLLSLARWILFFRRTGPRLVHFNINRLVEPVLAAWLLRLPSVMHFRDIPSRMEPRFVLGQRGFYWLMRRAGRWVANSGATLRDIEAQSSGTVSMIPNGIDLTDFDLRSEDPTPALTGRHRRARIAMVALLVKWKNHGALLEVARSLVGRGVESELLVAGDGPEEYAATLRGQAERLGVSGVVRFLGHVENVPALLRRVDILVHTADHEPFGRVFIEAMAARVPVVAFAGGAAPEVVVDGQTGILVSPGDASAMADAVAGLLADPAERARMGAAGRRRVEALYTLDRHAAAVLALHRELIAEREGRASA